MEHSTEIVKLFWKAFQSLKMEERKQLATRIMVDADISDNWFDYILMRKNGKRWDRI